MFRESVEGTGIVQAVPSTYKIPPFNYKTRDHFWVVVNYFRVANPGRRETILMDKENLVATVPPLCYYCEKSYSPILKNKPCTGNP